MDANNLQDSIHYFHILTAYCESHPNYPHCAELYAAGSGSQLGTSQRKVFDAVLGSAVLHAVANLQGKQQSDLIKVISTALKTKDLQIYFNNSQMEGVLNELKDSSTVQSPQGDSVFPVDTNVRATYVNGDVQEQITDTVTLDSKGNATHDMTIRYTYPVVKHSWSSMYADWYLGNVLRVIVPKNAKLNSMDSCDPDSSYEAGHAVWTCGFRLDRPQYSLTVHLNWTAPQVTTAGSTMRYSLLFQKQAGAHSTLKLTIIPPKGATVRSVQGGLQVSTPAPRATFSGPLTQDASFGIVYRA